MDEVYHFASPASPIDFERIPCRYSRPRSGHTHAWNMPAQKGRFMLASTSEVYGDLWFTATRRLSGKRQHYRHPQRYDEATTLRRAMTMGTQRHYGVDTRIVRIFNTTP
jgi:nucleoside-diphosphate-sugar epimerase